MKLSLPEQVKTALSMLEKSGFEAYAVGGCVRDSLLSLVPYDWDITSSALPEQVEKVFENFRIIETGMRHGTVTVLIDKMPLEITTFRIDGEYSDFRRPDSVTFTRSLSDDLSRRDFTMNAVAYNEKDGIVDLFGGQKDIENKIIRCVGDPDCRFGEDALRILRAVRFASVLGFEIEEKTDESIHKNKNLLKNIAGERIRVELLKLLAGRNVKKILLEYRDVLAVFIPELVPIFDFPQNTPYHKYDVYTHTAYTVEASPNEPYFRIAMLLHDIGKPYCLTTGANGVDHFYRHPEKSAELASAILKRLKFDNAAAERAVKIIAEHDAVIPKTEKSALKLLNRIGEETYRDIIKAKYADNEGKAEPRKDDRLLENMEELLDEIKKKGKCFSLKQLDINGDDIKIAGISDGKKIGQALNFLLEGVIEGKCDNEKEQLLCYLSKNF